MAYKKPALPSSLLEIWGILWVLTRDANIKRIEDLKGQELTMSFQYSPTE